MAKVRIKNDNLVIEVPDGADLLPYLKDTGIVFGCEKGECGSCICYISKGAENLERKNPREELTISKKATYPSQRLACMLRIKKGEIEIEY